MPTQKFLKIFQKVFKFIQNLDKFNIKLARTLLQIFSNYTLIIYQKFLKIFSEFPRNSTRSLRTVYVGCSLNSVKI